MLKFSFIAIILFCQSLFVSDATELTLSLSEQTDSIEITISNESEAPVPIEELKVFFGCDFIGNFCLRAHRLSGEKIQVRNNSKNFDTSFARRVRLEPNNSVGFTISKNMISKMLNLIEFEQVQLTVYYHNKAIDKVFSSQPIKVVVAKN